MLGSAARHPIYEGDRTETALNGYDVYLSSGGIGSLGFLSGNQGNKKVNIPEFTWKHALTLDQPGRSLSDVLRGVGWTNKLSTSVITVNQDTPTDFGQTGVSHPLNKLFPNQFPNIRTLEEWQSWETWEVSYAQLKSKTKVDPLPLLSEVLSGSITAPLRAESMDSSHERSVFDASIGHSRFTSRPFADLSWLDIASPQVAIGHRNFIETNLRENTASDVAVFHPYSGERTGIDLIATQFAIDEFQILEPSVIVPASIEQAIDKLSSDQKRSSTTDSTHLTIFEDGLLKRAFPTNKSSFHRAFSEKGILRTALSEPDGSHTDISKLGAVQTAIRESDRKQTSPTELTSREIGISESSSTHLIANHFEVDKISFPFGVAPPELASLNPLSLHSYPVADSKVSKVLQATNTLNTLLGEVEFQLEVHSLPTGQLAEATLTHFDANGLPIGGTITIDDDANGLGWFIDETPWENSEFNLPQTETLLRATPGSAAYGRYDLLTTILHELGHLAGIIHGNPAYDDRIQYINGSPTDLGNGYEAQLTHDLSHLADPTQLMSPYLAPGIL